MTESLRRPDERPPWELLTVGLLVLTLSCWLDTTVGPARPPNPGCEVRGAGCGPETGNSALNPDIPTSGSVLQAVIVGRLVRQSPPVLCPGVPFRELIERYAVRHGLDGRWVAAIIEAESGFDAGALSEEGAVGLMQLLPGTALDFGVLDPRDPAQNVAAGVRYLRRLLDRYGGDVARALAAYNAGPARVEGMGPWPAETRRFIWRVLAAYDRFRKACPGDSIF